MKTNHLFRWVGLGAALSVATSGYATQAPTPAPAPTTEPGAQQPAPAAEEPPRVDISLQRAIEMALEHNLNVVVSRLQTQVQAEGTNSAKGVYAPSMAATLNNLDSKTPAQNQLIGAQVLATTRTNYSFVWQQELGTGANYNVTFQNLRSTTNSNFSGFNPLFSSSVSAQITQPLARNFGVDPIKQRITVAQNGERISRAAFEGQVMDVVRNVSFAYLDLVFSIRNLEVARKSLSLAQDLLRNNRIQVEVGTMAPIDVLEAEAEVAAREEAVILAEEAIKTNEDSLKSLINDPDSPEFWTTGYNPSDAPTLEDVQINIDEAVREALQRRPELQQSRIELETRDYTVRYTKNQMLPQLDAVGSFALNGIGGTQLVRSDFAGAPSTIIPGGYGDAIDQIFGGNYRDWTLGLQISYPLGNSQVVAQHAQAQVSARQQRAQISANEILVAQDVRQSARSVETNRKRIDATRVARELAQRRLEAEQKKFEVGMSTSFLIVQAQRDLAQAAANELSALIDYNKAIVAFERAKGTILDRANVSVR
jgi:outer membrane protein TolC